MSIIVKCSTRRCYGILDNISGYFIISTSYFFFYIESITGDNFVFLQEVITWRLLLFFCIVYNGSLIIIICLVAEPLYQYSPDPHFAHSASTISLASLL